MSSQLEALAALIVVCWLWGFLIGYLTGRADGRDSMRHKNSLSK
jgi:hypothetical protein